MSVEEQFDAFWAKYPRKVNKKPAFQKFKAALKVTDFDTIMSALDAYIEDVARQNKKRKWLDYCHPNTWLNQHRWNNYAPKTEHKPLTDEQREAERQEYIAGLVRQNEKEWS